MTVTRGGVALERACVSQLTSHSPAFVFFIDSLKQYIMRSLLSTIATLTILSRECQTFQTTSIRRNNALVTPSVRIKLDNGWVNRPSVALASASTTILSGTMDTIKIFSKSSVSQSSASALFQSVAEKALSTPPIAYFLALMAAGCGIPVSEDALCIFAGAVWPTLPQTRKLRLVTALYLGVVVSDFLTFWIGRALRIGVFQPVAERLQLTSPEAEVDEASDPKSKEKVNRVKKIMANAGDYVGFVTRFSVGTRGPLMLFAGFSKRIPFAKFALGASVGAFFSLPVQLWAGYALGHRNPEAVVGVVAGISSFVIAAAVCVAIASWGTLMVSQVKRLLSQDA